MQEKAVSHLQSAASLWCSRSIWLPRLPYWTQVCTYIEVLPAVHGYLLHLHPSRLFLPALAICLTIGSSTSHAAATYHFFRLHNEGAIPCLHTRCGGTARPSLTTRQSASSSVLCAWDFTRTIGSSRATIFRRRQNLFFSDKDERKALSIKARNIRILFEIAKLLFSRQSTSTSRAFGQVSQLALRPPGLCSENHHRVVSWPSPANRCTT